MRFRKSHRGKYVLDIFGVNLARSDTVRHAMMRCQVPRVDRRILTCDDKQERQLES